jgi:hypothetical protein
VRRHAAIAGARRAVEEGDRFFEEIGAPAVVVVVDHDVIAVAGRNAGVRRGFHALAFLVRHQRDAARVDGRIAEDRDHLLRVAAVVHDRPRDVAERLSGHALRRAPQEYGPVLRARDDGDPDAFGALWTGGPGFDPGARTGRADRPCRPADAVLQIPGGGGREFEGDLTFGPECMVDPSIAVLGVAFVRIGHDRNDKRFAEIRGTPPRGEHGNLLGARADQHAGKLGHRGGMRGENARRSLSGIVGHVTAHGEVERVGLRIRRRVPAVFDHRLDGGMRGAAAHILHRGRRRFQQGLDEVAVAHEGGFRPVGIPGLGLEQQADAVLDDAPVVLRRQDAPEIETAPIGIGTCG